MSLPTDEAFARECSEKFTKIKTEWLNPAPHYVQRWTKMLEWLNKMEKEREKANNKETA